MKSNNHDETLLKARKSMPGPDSSHGPGPDLMSANTLTGDEVYNNQGESVGKIKDIMLDMRNGRVGYAVLSHGSILGIGEKLFAVPWNALKLDPENKRFTLDVEQDRLKAAPGFDKDRWPNMADQVWAKSIHDYYGTTLYLDDAPR